MTSGGEVAVVVRVFLAAHRPRLAAVGVEQHRGLLDRQAVLDAIDLPLDLEVDRLLQEAEAVEVLDLAPRAEGLPGAADADVGVAAEAPLLHVAVADAEPDDQRVQRARVLHRLDARAHVGLGDDLQQRRAGAVEVDPGHAVEVLVQALAGVLLEVRARQPHAARPALQHEVDPAALDDRHLVLADLVALGKVGVEVVLAREDRQRRDARTDGQAEADGALDRTAVGHRQRAGQRKVDCAGLGVGLRPEARAGAAEHLARRAELGVGLQADDDLPAAHQRRRARGAHCGLRACQSVACCSACAACSSAPSAK
jgi:hypothetical protein